MMNQKYDFHYENIINQYSENINPYSSIIVSDWMNNNHYVLIFLKNYF